MNFLRTLFWIALTVVVVVFAMHNWFAVTIDLFGGLQADVKLPVLMLIAFLIGWLPTYGWHKLWQWREGRRVTFAPTASPAAPPLAMSPGEPSAPPPWVAP